MSAAEADNLLIHTVNSFGRQHHLNRQRSKPIPFSTADANGAATKRAFSAPLSEMQNQNGGDRAAIITQSGGASRAFWFDAEACQDCDHSGASPPTPGMTRSSDAWHDALSEGAGASPVPPLMLSSVLAIMIRWLNAR